MKWTHFDSSATFKNILWYKFSNHADLSVIPFVSNKKTFCSFLKNIWKVSFVWKMNEKICFKKKCFCDKTLLSPFLGFYVKFVMTGLDSSIFVSEIKIILLSFDFHWITKFFKLIIIGQMFKKYQMIYNSFHQI